MSSVTLYTKSVLHQKTYTYETKLEASDIGLTTDGWAWKAWEHAASATTSLRVTSSEIEAVIRAFNLMKHSSEARDLLNLPLKSLRLSTVCRCYELLEAQIAERTDSLSDVSKHHVSLRTRKLLNRFLEAVGFESIHRIQSVFKTSLPMVRAGRSLISDLPIFGDGKVNEPVGAISHSSAENLRQRTAQILRMPLEQIAAACIGQLDEYERLEAWKIEILRKPPDLAVLRRISATGQGEWNSVDRVWASEVPIDAWTTAYLHLLYERFASKGMVAPRKIIRSDDIDAFIRLSVGSNVTGTRLVLPFPKSAQYLLACLLMLQIHTHWNVNSVLELTLRSLTTTEPPLDMQSFKSRTKSATPIVSVERADPAARALQFLVKRLEWLKKMRYIAENEQRLWLNYLTGEPYIGWGSMLKPFQAKWGLPNFSLEQIRAQTLAAQSVQVGGLALTKDSAGHASLSTTSLYVDKLLLRRLNSSVNLEFQRRLEADVRSVIKGSEARYLYPIGDGTSCINPHDPPFESDLEEGACKAQRCHLGEGCPNRRIVIDKNRVEEVVRTAAYYRDSWVRLYERNPEAFDAFHVPSMNFNFALLGVLRRGSYVRLVRAAEATLEKQQGRANG